MQRLAAVLAVLCCGLLAGAAIDASQNAPRAQFDNLEEHFDTDRSASNRKRDSPTGSGRFFRVCSPTNCRGRAATIRSGSCGSPGTAAGRFFDSGFVRWSAHRRQLRVLPHDRVSARPCGTQDARHGRPWQPRQPAGLCAFSSYRRGRSALQCRRTVEGHRRPDEPFVDAEDAGTECCSSPVRAARFSGRKRIRVDGSRSRVGRGTYRSVQSDQVPPPETADRHEHRQRRHDAVVEHERAHGDPLGWADDFVS